MADAPDFLAAVAAHQAGRLNDAEAAYRALLADHPAHADARHYLGLIAFQRGDFALAATTIEQAIATLESAGAEAPAEFHINLANALKRADRLDEAIVHYRRAIARRADLPAAWFNLALAWLAAGRDADAIAALDKTLALAPSLCGAWQALFECHCRALDDAAVLNTIAAAGRALKPLGPSPAKNEMSRRFGEWLVASGRHAAALAWLEPLARGNGVADQASNFASLNALGCALAGLGRLGEAEAVLRRALAVAPGAAAAMDNLACVLKDAGRNDEALALYRSLPNDALTAPDVASNYLFSALYSDQLDEATLLAEHRRLWANTPGARARLPAPQRTEPRLHIAYLSGDLRNHPVAYFLDGLLRAHDRDAVALTVYDNSPAADAWTTRLRSSGATWRCVRALSDAALVEAIRADAPDVLIELNGHTAHHRLAALASRAAPVQVSYLGYPFTTAAPGIDWRLVDAVVESSGSEIWSTERLWRLDRSYYAYTPPTDAPAITPLPALRHRHLTFGVCSNLAKVSPSALDCWAALLRAMPDTRLVWRTRAFADRATEQSMRQALVARGVAGKRLRLLPWAAHGERWQVFAQIDVALDTFPYNQATNTCEALWMGVPTLSIAGVAHRSRMGASLLGDAGLAEWAFAAGARPDAEAFAAFAQTLLDGGSAAGIQALATLRAGLRERVAASRLCDATDAARQIEAACRAMRDEVRGAV